MRLVKLAAGVIVSAGLLVAGRPATGGLPPWSPWLELHHLLGPLFQIFPGPGVKSYVPSIFLHSRSLTIDHTLVGGTDLTNYTVYISLALGASRIQNASCYDVVFAADSGNVTPLPWEPTPTCNAATGAFAAHIKIPTVSHTSDTVFYVFYDNAGIASFQSTGSAWDSSYVAMWHLSDGITLSGAESTTNGYNLTNVSAVTATTGQVDGGANFGGADYLSSSGFTWSTSSPSPVTVSFWAYKATADAGTTTQPFGPTTGTLNFRCQFFSDHFVYWDYGDSSVNGRVSVSYAGHYDTFTYVTLTSGGGTGGMAIYFDGSSVATTGVSDHPTAVNSPFNIGQWNGQFWIGKLDEPSFSNVVRPAGWVSANYHATKTSPDLVAVGSEI